MRIRRLLALALGATLATSGLAACDPLADGPPTSNSSADRSAATAQLDTLPVGTWASMSGYSRDRFRHWISQGEGCDTRDVVLKRGGQGVVTTADCKITKGTWFSVYDGKTVSDPQDIDIDHMVPLANAWRTGAASWTDEQRDGVRQRPGPAAADRGHDDLEPVQGRPGPVRVEAAAA